MQPTMKLRWKKVDSLNKRDPAITNAYGTYHVLQQWWEGTKTVQVGDDAFVFPIGVEVGEWRDIPIEEET